MKKIFLVSLFFLVIHLMNAQGNLQFNQVLLVDVTVAGNAVTVPAGKVWKLENVALASNNAYVQLQYSGSNFFLSNSSSNYNHFPFWLPGGNAVVITGSAAGKLSVIEFNVVP